VTSDSPRHLGRKLQLAVASLGPCGYAPIVPATAASAVLAAIYAGLPPIGPAIDGGVALATIILGVWAADLAEREWGHDARRIVIDEGAGMAVTLCGQPAGVATAVLAFFAFRFFDVVKPFPARRAEGLRGGFGVVADDVMAGVYANLAVRVAAWALARIGA
jgi:phosphatidylglycerophosphatase A